ncbi:MAG: PD-(D/E)XK nuclease family protein [Rickettsiales bacterium]|nr:PD-(D/E)XK nuclease family protein [Rickettsiales bacterium]
MSVNKVHKRNIFAINPQDNYCEILASKALEIFGVNNLAKTRIFLPSRRSVAILKNEFVKQSGNKSIILPKIQAIGDIDELETSLETLNNSENIENLINQKAKKLRVISRHQEILILTDIIRKSREFGAGGLNNARNISMHQALKLAESLLEILDDLKRYKSINDNLVEDYFAELSKHKQISVNFVNFIRDEYPKILENKGFTTAIDKRNQILDNFTKNIKTDDKIIIAGTLGTLSNTRELIKKTLTLKNGYYFLPFIDLDFNFNENSDNKTHHQFLVYKNLEQLNVSAAEIEILGSNKNDKSAIINKIFSENNKIENAENFVKIIEAENLSEEAKILAIILLENLSQNKSSALVTNNRNLARFVSLYLKKWNINIDDSAGKNFLDSNEGNFLISTLNLISKKNIISFLSLLKNDLSLQEISKSKKDFLISQIEEASRKSNIKNIFDLRNFLEEEAKIIFFEAFEIIEKYRDKFNYKIDEIFADLETLIKKFSQNEMIFGEENFIESYEIIEFIKKSSLDFPLAELDFLSNLAESFFSGIKIRAKYGVTSKIAILSPIEARLTNYDCYILGGLTQGSWPRERFSVWLTDKMKSDAALPNSDFFASLANHDFANLLHSKKVFLSFSQKENGELNTESPLVTRIKAFAEANNINFSDKYYKNLLNEFENIHLEKSPKTQNKPYPKPDISYRPRVISATEFETLIANPYEFYAKKILKLKQLDELERESDAKEYGNFIHKIMEEFSNFHQLEIEKITLENFNNIIAKIYNDFLAKNLANETWLLKTSIMAKEIVKIERNICVCIEKIINENSGKTTINIGNFEVLIKCKADRIEILEENNYSIADYKTGNIPNGKDFKNHKKPQILIEAVVLKNNGFDFQKESPTEEINLDKIYYYKLSKSSEYPVRKEYNLPIYEMIIANLNNLLEDFFNPQKPFLVCPRNDIKPSHRNYFHLERI